MPDVKAGYLLGLSFSAGSGQVEGRLCLRPNMTCQYYRASRTLSVTRSVSVNAGLLIDIAMNIGARPVFRDFTITGRMPCADRPFAPYKCTTWCKRCMKRRMARRIDGAEYAFDSPDRYVLCGKVSVGRPKSARVRSVCQQSVPWVVRSTAATLTWLYSSA